VAARPAACAAPANTQPARPITIMVDSGFMVHPLASGAARHARNEPTVANTRGCNPL
jgi:hypothetical protein